MPLITEKMLMAKVLRLYKELPCLWDANHPLHTSKEARGRAFNILLKKFQKIDSNAILHDLKKKLEYMKSVHRREYKRVLANKVEGLEYTPKLWYYNYMSFLTNEHDPEAVAKTIYINSNEEEIFNEQPGARYENRESGEEDNVQQHIDVFQISDDEDSERKEGEIEEENRLNEVQTMTDSFGKTVGLQLQELDTTQRHIAEKLIAEVIFYGRIGRLRPLTSLDLKDEDDV